MVQESESRFCSDQQTILQVLDPIHRSLLINNSEFESTSNNNNNDTNQLNQFSTKTCQLLSRQQQQQQQLQQEKQHRTNSTENKHFFHDAGFSKKTDATCVSDSNCLMLFHENCNMLDELECTTPSNDEKQNLNEIKQSGKNIQIRIVSNKKRSSERNSIEMLSSESQTDSSTNDCVDTDSEVELSSGTGDDRNTVTYSGSTNTDDFSDYNNFESSSNDEATTTSSDSNAPMIQIVQEIREQRMVVSTVHVNKKKVKSFQRNKTNRTSEVPKGKPKWKTKQKIIDDNVCNEMLDETINWNVIEGAAEQDHSIESPMADDTIIIGQLKAKPKFSQRKMGKLMERRLSRVHSENVTQALNQAATDIPCPVQPIRGKAIAPAKPPRTFTSSSSKTSSDSIGANTATTIAIEDFHKPLASQHSPGCGWIFDKTFKPATIHPTCPTLDDINDFENPKKIGWVSSIQKREEFMQVLNMLNDDHQMASKITSSNLTPEPQFRISHKEDIDQVDSVVPPKPAIRRSKRLSLTQNETRRSTSPVTPVKRASNFSSHSVPNSIHDDVEICKKCKLQIIEPSGGARKSFGKGAIKRTKLFFKASKNIWHKPKTVKASTKSFDDFHEHERYVDLEDNVADTPTKFNLNRTTEFNTNGSQRIEKRTEKALDLTPKHSENPNNVESSLRMFDKLLTSVKTTPPKKPIRQSLAHKDITRSPSNNEEVNFDFERIVDSPRREKTFKLSPRKLFFPSSEKQPRLGDNSYRSFETDDRDHLKECIVEYLRSINEEMDQKQRDVDYATVPRRRSRIRNFSTSSDAIDYIPQHQRVVEIDCHPEPLYSEIVVQPPTSSLNHIIVNDNPKAIYTTVNKPKSQKCVDPTVANVVDEEAMHKSWSSLDRLPINNNLTDSVLNMLELMKQQNLEEDSLNRVETEGDSKVKNSWVIEPPVVQLTSERLQQTVFNAIDKPNDDNISVETFCTESVCDDVIRGDSVNNNIVSTIDRLENLVTTISLVDSETDDDNDSEPFQETTLKTHSNDDSVDYCSIVEEMTAKGPTTIVSVNSVPRNEKSLQPNTTAVELSGNRRSHKLQSPLVAAPSMIEIPDQFMLKLTNQIVAQREIRNQLKHAIQICRTTKEFECSSELIEAERLLLVSAKKESNAKLELTRIDYEENGLTASPTKCVGSVTIKKIEFDLKEEEMLEQIFQLTYVCVCSYRDQVVATQSQERNGNKVKFDDIAIKIGSLNSKFEIKLEVYVLRLPRPLRKYSHESKYHLNKIPKKSLIPNPVKLFSSSSTSNNKLISDTEESRFRLRAVTTLSVNALSAEKFEIIRNNSWPKIHVFISYNTKCLNLKINDQFTHLTGALRTEFICEINLSDSGLSGFLNITDDSKTMRKLWGRLNGCTVEFWNNDIDCLNEKAPQLEIDLVRCTNELFELVDDKFSVAIFNENVVDRSDKRRIIHYWIGAYNQNDLKIWLTDMNRILKFVKDWNI